MQTPLHGNQGDREPARALEAPSGLTVAISRETGGRGGSIARRLGRKLGWQVYTQELLEFLNSNESARAHVLADVAADAAAWADAELTRLRRDKIIAAGVELGEMPRLILTLAARGEVILVGRGAGYLLSHLSTLHVRPVVAPLSERIAYMSQLLRRTREDAAVVVRERDERRAEYLLKTFNRRVGDLCDYDLVLNSYSLGEEACSELVLAAVHSKKRALEPDEDR